MAKKKLLSSMSDDIERIERQLKEAKAREAKRKLELAVEIFGPLILPKKEICDFCDKNRHIFPYVQEKLEKEFLQIIEDIKTGKVVIEVKEIEKEKSSSLEEELEKEE